MKLIYASALLLFAACNSADKNAETTTSMSMSGAYNILSTSVKGDSTDTTYTSGHQLKIYTDGYMMYANINSPDSISGFGIGSYTSSKDTVTENVIFNAFDSSYSDKAESFQLAIEKTDKGYKQVINDMVANNGQHFRLTETYDSVGTGAKTALDGAWKQVKQYQIKGKDTVTGTGTQYKTYYAGHVIWGHTWADSLKKNHTGIGFGKFELKDNKVKESMTASTYAQVRGKDFDIDIEMNGTDEFKQTMNNADGSKSVEVYQRLK